MLKTFGFLGYVWLMVVVSYILIAILSPVFVDMSSQSVAAMQATSNMSNYPGTVAGVAGFPFWVWLIPGGLGIAVTVAKLKIDAASRY